MDAVYEEFFEDEKELSLWHRRFRQDGDFSDSEHMLLARLWLFCCE